MRLTRDIAPPVRRPIAPGHWRLLAPALLAWALVAVLLARPGNAVWIAGTSLACGVILLASRRMRGVAAAWGVLAVTCAALLLVSARVELLQEARAASALGAEAAAHRHLAVEVTLTGYPAVTAGLFGERAWVPARTETPVTPVLLWLDERAPPGWAPGTRVRVRGVPTALPATSSAAFGIGVREFEALGPSARGSMPDRITEVLGQSAAGLREGLREAATQLPGAELVPGLAVGDTSLVDEAVDEAMRDSSLSHLLAVSGANCALITGAVAACASRLGAGRRLRSVVAALGLAAFVVVVGPDPSVLRATVMAVVVLVSRFGGRPEAGLPALGIAILILIAVDPWQALHAGFALSVAATAGILLLAGPLTLVARRLWLPKPLAIAVAVAVAAQFACGPFLLLLQPGLPAVGVLANVVAGPAAPAGTALGIAAALATPLSTHLGLALVWLASWPARWITFVAEISAGLPLARWVWPDGWSGAILLAIAEAAALLAWLVWTGKVRVPATPPLRPRLPWHPEPRKPRALRAVAAVLAAAASGIIVATSLIVPLAQRAATPRDWAVVVCDVAQGDAILLREPSDPGRVILIDTGAERTLLEACLDRFGVASIDLLVLTHDDQDHVGALDAIAGRVSRALIAPGQAGEMGEPRDVVRQLEAAEIPFAVGAAGDISSPGPGAAWRVLAPAPGARPGSANAASLVLEVEVGGLRVLLLGDTGQAEQEALLRAYPELRADVLKVGHHGSRDRVPGLAARVGAEIALVSVGAENRYGHPNAQVVAELARAGIPLLRTDQHGSLALAPGAGGAPAVWVEHAEPRVSGRR